MPDEHDDDSGELDRPPSFFPYEGEDVDEKRTADMGEPVEVAVEGVFLVQTNGEVQRFVLLTDGERKLQIMIGAPEATAISLTLEGAQPDRPLTHDLTKVIMERLGGVLKRVVIDDIWNKTFYAKVYISHGKQEIEIDSRPSDAIALALRWTAPIYVCEGILEQDGD